MLKIDLSKWLFYWNRILISSKRFVNTIFLRKNLERKLKGELYGYTIIKKYYWSRIHLIEQTCPSKEKIKLKLSNIIN